MTDSRSRARQLSTQSYAQGDYTGWFEALYTEAEGNINAIPWADRGTNQWLREWIDRSAANWQNRRILVVGCGLGDDAEYLATLGATVTAFDLSPTAIAWCKQRFPTSTVDYRAVDLFTAPVDWVRKFDLVVEIYTIQALPANIRPQAIACIGEFVAPDGQLFVVCRARNPEDPCEHVPFPLTQSELAQFTATGLVEVSFEDFVDNLESSPIRRFRIVYQRFKQLTVGC
jgi:SAM-dependent methyltransferase